MLRKNIQKHPLITFYIVTCLFSWILWGLMIASQKGWLPFYVPVHWIGSFGPFVGAIIASLLIGGGGEVKKLFSLKFRFSLKFYLISIFGVAILYFLSLAVFYFIGNADFVSTGFPKLIELLWQIPILFPIFMIIAGPLGEEVGWRRFMLPRLLEKNNFTKANLICGFWWAFWHLPLFWMAGSGQYGMPLLLFFLEIIAVSVFFAWVYVNTAGSLWAALLTHTGMNVAGFMISDTYKLDSNLSYNIIFFIALLVSAILIAIKTPQKKIELSIK